MRRFVCALLCAASVAVSAQEQRAPSPAGTSATQVGSAWIEISYGRPILRGRTNVFGSAETTALSVDQLTWGFTDVTPQGGALRLSWEKTTAAIPFKIVK